MVYVLYAIQIIWYTASIAYSIYDIQTKYDTRFIPYISNTVYNRGYLIRFKVLRFTLIRFMRLKINQSIIYLIGRLNDNVSKKTVCFFMQRGNYCELVKNRF